MHIPELRPEGQASCRTHLWEDYGDAVLGGSLAGALFRSPVMGPLPVGGGGSSTIFFVFLCLFLTLDFSCFLFCFLAEGRVCMLPLPGSSRWAPCLCPCSALLYRPGIFWRGDGHTAGALVFSVVLCSAAASRGGPLDWLVWWLEVGVALYSWIPQAWNNHTASSWQVVCPHHTPNSRTLHRQQPETQRQSFCGRGPFACSGALARI